LGRQPDKLAAASAQLREDALPLVCDLARLEEIESAVTDLRRRVGRFDVLVHCASTSRFGSELALSDAEWVSGFEVKVFGAPRLIRAAWPHVAEARGAGVNIGGVGARSRPVSPMLCRGRSAPR
jgi:3-oxoacyl-[acyl-carrier protein] reductase